MSGANKSNQIQITVTPWSSENQFEVMSLHICEELGGKIARGELDFTITSYKDSEALGKITEETEGEIRIKDLRPGGLEYIIPIFVTSRCWKLNVFSIAFVCIKNSDFMTKTHIQSFDNISDAIDLLYPGEKDIRTAPDSTIINLPIQQKLSTDYEMCTKLCQSYRKNTIFCFGMEGLMIKELCGESNSYGNIETPGISKSSIIVTNLDMGPLFPTTFNYDKYLNSEPYEPEEGLNTKFCSATINYTGYHIQRKGYEDIIGNQLYNQRLMNGKLYSTETIRGIYMPKYKIGDVIIYLMSEDSPKTPYISYLCYSNEFHYSLAGAKKKDRLGFKVSWESKLVGLERGTWTEKNEGV